MGCLLRWFGWKLTTFGGNWLHYNSTILYFSALLTMVVFYFQFMPAAFEGACRSTLICLAAVLVNVTVTPYFFIPGLLAAKAMGFLHVYFKKGYRWWQDEAMTWKPVSLTIFCLQFKFDGNFALLSFRCWPLDRNKFLHMPRQHSCRAMYKIL